MSAAFIIKFKTKYSSLKYKGEGYKYAEFKNIDRFEKAVWVPFVNCTLHSGSIGSPKLAAAVALTGAHKAADIAAVSAELDDFVFVTHAVNEEDIGSFFVNNFAEYDLHEDMEEFFDFEAFGKHIVDKYDGRFVDGGFVCCTRPYSFEKLLERIDVEEAEDEGMNMGGI